MTNLPEWIKKQKDELLACKYPEDSPLDMQIVKAFEIAWEALSFLQEYTYTDAEGPELRAQNARCHRMAKEAMKKIEELGK